MRLCKKLTIKFINSFEIFKKKNKIMYKLYLFANIKIYLIFHISLLKKYERNSDIADVLIYKLQNEKKEYEIEKPIYFKIKYN